MYYCSNCGYPVSGLGRCGHCGANLSSQASGSLGGMNAARGNYESMERYRREAESKETRKKEILRKYGYIPMIGITPAVVTAVVGFGGLALAFFSSLLYLILYGVAMLVLLCLFYVHTLDQSGLLNCYKYTSDLNTEAIWLTRFAYILPVLGYIGAYIFKSTSNPDIAFIVSFIGAFLLHFSLNRIANAHGG